ncbi:hypothetical protein L1987_70547 [Smallanthus sonchifolius]|uniref:Uncharacterized protein n=1 Tax=Smallanthus sonchifolius TaxID=185202 RepID=A0ACB9AQM1_9ASTR|nr:hypothetical protein L1987_70547 [Smallanthus sonchifolius]
MNPNNFPDHEHLKCPRCDSGNTKFCYYNNYNLTQPRHFCKNCRRYWTKGGTLRNIPIGGGSRKIAKRASNSSNRASLATAPPTTTATTPLAVPEPYRSGNHVEVESGGYSMGPFGSLLMEGSNFDLVRKSGEDVLVRNPIGDDFGSNLLRLNDESNGGSESGWPDLSMFTLGSSFR